MNKHIHQKVDPGLANYPYWSIRSAVRLTNLPVKIRIENLLPKLATNVSLGMYN
jgi:hypothetical protein